MKTFKLDNGMQIVVIPDHRLPVVTHMIWYRVGAADEQPGVSGIAHFLEHLMFKSTDNLKSGEFSRTISRIGGKDNATTTPDATFYFQRVAKNHLRTVMELEANRMVNLKLTESEIVTERNVILEERRTRIDRDPVKVLNERLLAALYLNHPYRIPTLGWSHEMVKLSRVDAAEFYQRYYAPNNAVLVVAGDVTVKEVRNHAIATYGKNNRNPHLKARVRPSEPEHLTPRHVVLIDRRAARPTLFRFYLTPSYSTAKPAEAESIDLLMSIIGQGDTSRLFKSLVIEKKLAVSAGATFFGEGRDSGRIAVFAVAAKDISLNEIEKEIDRVLSDIKKNGIAQKELDRAKAKFEVKSVFRADNQLNLARLYGEGLTSGRTVENINSLQDRILAITLENISKAASTYLDPRRSATGFLLRKSEGDNPRSIAKSTSAQE